MGGLSSCPHPSHSLSCVLTHDLPLYLGCSFYPRIRYTKEEMKVTWETRKIMDLPDLAVSCTAVRIPTLRAHAEAITIETEKPCSPEQAKEILAASPGVRLADAPADKLYPMPITATEAYDVEVGRVRQSEVFGETGLDLFVCGDQLLRGAALNAVLVAEAALDTVGEGLVAGSL